MLDGQERRKKRSMLAEAAKAVDFNRIERLLWGLYKHVGHPPIPPLMLFKALLFESWYGLSDVEVLMA